jgi:hypothetical protein
MRAESVGSVSGVIRYFVEVIAVDLSVSNHSRVRRVRATLWTVACDSLRDREQGRLLAKVQFPRALFRVRLAAMIFSSFHFHIKSDEEPDHGAKGERQTDSADQKNFLHAFRRFNSLAIRGSDHALLIHRFHAVAAAVSAAISNSADGNGANALCSTSRYVFRPPFSEGRN